MSPSPSILALSSILTVRVFLTSILDMEHAAVTDERFTSGAWKAISHSHLRPDFQHWRTAGLRAEGITHFMQLTLIRLHCLRKETH